MLSPSPLLEDVNISVGSDYIVVQSRYQRSVYGANGTLIGLGYMPVARGRIRVAWVPGMLFALTFMSLGGAALWFVIR